MKQKLSEEVMRRRNLNDVVLGAVRIQGQRIAGALGEVFTPLLQPEEVLPDLGLHLELYGRSLELHRRQMEDADEAHRQQLTRLDALRGRRDEQTGRLKKRYLSLRATCTGVFGESTLAPLGLDFNLAQEAKGVLAQCRIVRGRLLQPDVELVPERWLSEPVDPESLAQELGDDVEALSRTLREMVDGQKTVDLRLVAKQKAIAEHDAAFIPIAQALEATFRLAGEVELADRIRPTIRRLTRPNDGEPSSEGSPSEEAASEGAPSEEALSEEAPSEEAPSEVAPSEESVEKSSAPSEESSEEDRTATAI